MKCDEGRPGCQRCLNLSLSCEWASPAKRTKVKGRPKSPVPVRPLQPARPRWASPTNDATHSVLETLKAFSHPLAAHYANKLAILWPPSTDWSSSHPLCPPADYSPLYYQPSEPGIPCANSLSLSQLDRKYFQYFPSSSVVFYYMKKWQWSSFNYLYQGPAATNTIIMRMILAMSANDMHRNGLVTRSPGRPTAEDHARYHYGTAVKEFRGLLETPRPHVAPAELEMMFVTMFLMVTYEWQFGHSVNHLQLHLLGVRSLLETHPDLLHVKDVNDILLSSDTQQSDNPGNQVSLIPEQLLL